VRSTCTGGYPPAGIDGTHYKTSSTIGRNKMTNLYNTVQEDLVSTLLDANRLIESVIICGSRSLSLSCKTTVVLVETLNVGLDLALDSIPSSYKETETRLHSLFEEVQS